MGIQLVIDNPGEGEWVYGGEQGVAGDPGVATWRNNAANTRIDISVETVNGLSVRARLAQFENGAQVQVRIGGQDRLYSVQSIVDNTSWFELTVTLESESDTFVMADGQTTSLALNLPKGAGGSGVTDHGALSGLTDDDHPQYLKQSDGDARYYTQGQVDSAIAGKADAVHPHTESDITDLDKYTQAEVNSALTGKADTVHPHVESDITDLDKYTQAEVNSALAGKLDTSHDGGPEHIDWSVTGAEQVHADRYSSGSGGATNTVSATSPLENLTDNVNPNIAIEEQGDRTMFGRALGAGAGRPGPLTHTQARTLLDVEEGSVAAGTAGDAHVSTDGSSHSKVNANEAAIAALGTAADQDIGTSVGDVVGVVDVGAGTPGLGALDGRNLTRTRAQMNFGVGVWQCVGTNGEVPTAGQFSADDGTADASPSSATSILIHGQGVLGGSNSLMADLQTGDRLFFANPDAGVFHIFYVTGAITGANPYTVPVSYDGGQGASFDLTLEYGVALVRSESTASGNTIITQDTDVEVDPNTAILNFEGSGLTVIPEGGGKVTIQVAAGAAPVDSWGPVGFPRTGIIHPIANDYDASMINNDAASAPGAQVSNALDNIHLAQQSTATSYGNHAAGTGDRHDTGEVDNASTANGGLGTATDALNDLDSSKAETSDTRFPDAGEKLALQGTVNTPSNANRYVTNDDPRNADARAPTPHPHVLADVSDAGTAAAADVGNQDAGDLPALSAVGTLPITDVAGNTGTHYADSFYIQLANGRIGGIYGDSVQWTAPGGILYGVYEDELDFADGTNFTQYRINGITSDLPGWSILGRVYLTDMGQLDANTTKLAGIEAGAKDDQNADEVPYSGTLLATQVEGALNELDADKAETVHAYDSHSGAVPFADLPTGTGATEVAVGNHTHATLPTVDEKAALGASETPSGTNPFLTEDAIGSVYSQLNPLLSDGPLAAILVGDNAPAVAGNTVATDSFYVDRIGGIMYQSTGNPSDGDTGNGWNIVGSGGGAWGSITGTLSAQADLQGELDAKVDTDGTSPQDAVLMAERTDHVNTPAAGTGELWTRDSTDPSAEASTAWFTDDAGNDIRLGADSYISSNALTAITATDPGSGNFKFNNAVAGSATEIYISTEDVHGLGYGNIWFKSLNAGSQLIFIREDYPNDRFRVWVTGVTDNTGWATISVDSAQDSQSPAWSELKNGERYIISAHSNVADLKPVELSGAGLPDASTGNGLALGTIYVDTTGDRAYTLVDATTDSNVWSAGTVIIQDTLANQPNYDPTLMPGAYFQSTTVPYNTLYRSDGVTWVETRSTINGLPWMGTQGFFGASSAGAPGIMSGATATTILSEFDGAAKGLVPSGGAGSADDALLGDATFGSPKIPVANLKNGGLLSELETALQADIDVIVSSKAGDFARFTDGEKLSELAEDDQIAVEDGSTGSKQYMQGAKALGVSVEDNGTAEVNSDGGGLFRAINFTNLDTLGGSLTPSGTPGDRTLDVTLPPAPPSGSGNNAALGEWTWMTGTGSPTNGNFKTGGLTLKSAVVEIRIPDQPGAPSIAGYAKSLLEGLLVGDTLLLQDAADPTGDSAHYLVESRSYSAGVTTLGVSLNVGGQAPANSSFSAKSYSLQILKSGAAPIYEASDAGGTIAADGTWNPLPGALVNLTLPDGTYLVSWNGEIAHSVAATGAQVGLHVGVNPNGESVTAGTERGIQLLADYPMPVSLQAVITISGGGGFGGVRPVANFPSPPAGTTTVGNSHISVIRVGVIS